MCLTPVDTVCLHQQERRRMYNYTQTRPAQRLDSIIEKFTHRLWAQDSQELGHVLRTLCAAEALFYKFNNSQYFSLISPCTLARMLHKSLANTGCS
jgi:hypothetical protein